MVNIFSLKISIIISGRIFKYKEHYQNILNVENCLTLNQFKYPIGTLIFFNP